MKQLAKRKRIPYGISLVHIKQLKKLINHGNYF